MTPPEKDVLLDDEMETPDSVPAPIEASETGLEPVALTPQEVEGLRRECADLRNQLLRRRADFENFRKRAERDRESLAQEARADLLAGLLPTLDNIEKALSVSGQDDASIREGVLLTYRNLLAFLEAQGVVAKDPTGEMFDPQQHQALLHEPAPGSPDGTIVETFRKAYFLKDRLLRPALVKVAKEANG